MTDRESKWYLLSIQWVLRLTGQVVREPTGAEAEKKSISFPMVNGILIDTEDDTNSKPIAANKGFFSGRARATILRKEDAVVGAAEKVPGSTLDSSESLFVGNCDGVEVLGLDSL